ncbi:hypothetical protein [Marinithermus hydrothermalis]|uniref:Uncharacterized protein n=1 Tax=Marinithermus hydrothermalis (strain DSM 14884 / JCM 11576 / T1) TaxID=869210 RepID=F2NN95_MARHT|nr:hypothetical protein [Marinithermus hydrothermalis]AEB10936.1 hypothetical protein Marky_0173 [Marinithermus hydrothermalis DSM 14884]
MTPCEERLRHAEHAWKQERQRAERLEQECRQCHERLVALKGELTRMRGLEDELRRCRQKLEDLEAFKARVTRPRFWVREFAETFAEELDKLEPLLTPGGTGSASGEAVAWAEGLVRLLRALEDQGYERQRVEDARRLLLALWVWLRWEEVKHLFELDENLG